MAKAKTRKQAIKRAWQINAMLDTLRQKAQALSEDIADVEDNEDYDDFSLRALRQTLDDLAGFDLEDAIITAEE